MEKLSDSLGENVRERIQRAAQGFKKLQALEPKPLPGPTHFCIWKSQTAMDIWLFCLQNQITQGDYIIAWVKLHGKEPNTDLFDRPYVNSIESNGDITPATFDSYQVNINGHKTCRICHNSGFAYVVRGILLDDRLMPGPLGKVVCWCKR